MRLGLDILELEIAAARIEARLEMNADLAGLWRMETCLMEAVASVGLEDIQIQAHDLFARLSLSNAAWVNPRGADMAQSILLHLRRSSLDDFETAIRSLEKDFHPSRVLVKDYRPVNHDVIVKMGEILETGMSPFLTALRCTSLYALASERASPAVERLLFCFCDNALRVSNKETANFSSNFIGGSAPRSATILFPSLALSDAGIALWQPTRLSRVEELCKAFHLSLKKSIGRFGLLLGWKDKDERAISQERRKSGLHDLVSLVMQKPILTSADIQTSLGVSHRTSYNLIQRAVEADVLKPITERGYARVWTTPNLRSLLRVRPRQNPVSLIPAPASTQLDPSEPLGVWDIDEVFQDFDKAVRKFEEMMQGISDRKSQRESLVFDRNLIEDTND